ncbi:ATPase AAA [Spirochaetia bacterium]|nr:ATPase AAA [Spirochaetia bacterium]
MGIEAILAGLDAEQRKAATAEFNAVVTAGAGSGKTKVLAARYAWLVMEKDYKADEILTLTFTNKAVSEMYSRIYGLLAEQQDNGRARQAIAEFHKAHIMTLDSFCSGIARTAAPRYGISPDFVSDNPAVRELAVDAALPFVLAHRDNPALQTLMADRKIRTVAEELFAETVLQYSPISSPLDFNAFIEKQNAEILRQWKLKTEETQSLVGVIAHELGQIVKTSGVLYTNLKNCFANPVPAAPDIAPLLHNDSNDRNVVSLREQISGYFAWLNELKSVSLAGRHAAEFTIIKENLKELKNRLYGELESIANIALQSDITAAVFPLVEEFQHQFNRQKREAGLLTFNDIAHLSVDALTQYPDIRRVYKDTFKSIMVDEFQDNNGLQRDLIFLLAEESSRNTQGLPKPEEIGGNKMFFVGDEKQSIYRFRGADVSVFRSLAQTLSPASDSTPLSLVHNYRSRPILVAAFNRIFGGLSAEPETAPEPSRGAVFLPDHGKLPAYEAAYHRVSALTDIDAEDMKNPPVHFCFLDKGQLQKDDPQALSNYDLEAAYIAAQIRQMVDSGCQIQERGKDGIRLRPCTYRDFAVLQRSYSHQSALETQCKNFGIPFNADRPAGLFNDAPVNDLHAYLRLLVYPHDRIAYAALIRSPFMRLSDLTLSVCLLNGEETEGFQIPFDEKLEAQIPVEERERFAQARARYQTLSEEARTLPVTSLLTKLWYDEGYRYETLWSASSQIYGELFDLFFELARDTDRRGKSLADFLDYLEDLITQEERPDDLTIPAEEEGGVRIMSIHKSKGLEFPVVFVYCCGSSGRNETNNRAVYFSDKWGITINLPKAAELPGNSGNYFYNLQREEEAQKRTAELRRLLYVAMTRAESRLFLTVSLPEQTKTERDGNDGPVPDATENPREFIQTRIIQLKEKKTDSNTVSSFLDLLLPTLVSDEDEIPPYSIEAIPLYSRSELVALAAKQRREASDQGSVDLLSVDQRPLDLRSGTSARSMIEAANAAAAFYAQAETVPDPAPAVTAIPASSLHIATGGESAPQPSAVSTTNAVTAQPATVSGGNITASTPATPDIDRLLIKAGLESADFGTIVHAFLEGRFNNRKPVIPPKIQARLDDNSLAAIREAAQAMAEGFLNSDLGRLSLDASYREPEFPILTLVQTGDNTIPVTGQIDLLFESENSMYVVDFKTDRVEEPDRHLAQLAVYTRAITDIFNKPVRPWLFYLRSGSAVELSDRIGEVDIAALVHDY